MPSFQTEVPHELGASEARSRVEALVTKIGEQYGDMISDLEGDWIQNRLNVSFRAMGFAIQSDVHVEEERVAVNGKIPMAALPFKGKIQNTIVDKLNELLTK